MIILTARILGWQFGLARAIGAVVFAVNYVAFYGKENAAG